MYNLIKRRFVREGSSCKYFFQPLENFHYLTKKKKKKIQKVENWKVRFHYF